jgi:hypothetical protein
LARMAKPLLVMTTGLMQMVEPARFNSFLFRYRTCYWVVTVVSPHGEPGVGTRQRQPWSTPVILRGPMGHAVVAVVRWACSSS